jgi:hypothetical protein
MAKKIIFTFFCILSGFVLISFGQDPRRVNELQSFTIIPPADSVRVANETTIIEFHGNEKTYHAETRFFLKGAMPLASSAMQTVESYMREPKSVESFDKGLIDSMKPTFPDTRSIDKRFLYFNRRPAIQGTFLFTAADSAMKGRYLALLVEERSSIYIFTWSTTADLFADWNSAVENSIKSLEFE